MPSYFPDLLIWNVTERQKNENKQLKKYLILKNNMMTDKEFLGRIANVLNFKSMVKIVYCIVDLRFYKKYQQT